VGVGGLLYKPRCHSILGLHPIGRPQHLNWGHVGEVTPQEQWLQWSETSAISRSQNPRPNHTKYSLAGLPESQVGTMATSLVYEIHRHHADNSCHYFLRDKSPDQNEWSTKRPDEFTASICVDSDPDIYKFKHCDGRIQKWNVSTINGLVFTCHYCKPHHLDK
jgi:hypothetical protein